MLVREPLAGDLRKCQLQTVKIVHLLSVVISEGLFIKVAKQMKRLDACIGSANATLQETLEIFQPIRVEPSAHVLNGMVNDLMPES